MLSASRTAARGVASAMLLRSRRLPFGSAGAVRPAQHSRQLMSGARCCAAHASSTTSSSEHFTITTPLYYVNAGAWCLSLGDRLKQE